MYLLASKEHDGHRISKRELKAELRSKSGAIHVYHGISKRELKAIIAVAIIGATSFMNLKKRIESETLYSHS